MPLKFIPTNVKYNDSGEFKNISIPADRAYMGEVITVSSTQPTNSDNKLWINTNEQTKQTYQIPTVSESLALGVNNASVGDIIRVSEIDNLGKPTSWQHISLNKIICNKNLLNNWCFVGGGSQLSYGTFPINQRGQSSYPGPGYGIDRWSCATSSVTVLCGDSNYIVLKSSTAGSQNLLIQYFDNKELLAGKTVTISAIINNKLAQSTISIPADSSTWGSTIGSGAAAGNCAIYLRYLNSKLCFVFYAGSTYTANTNILIKAAKLELGSYQTLAHNEGTEESPNWVLNEIPDYGEELEKCRRYLFIVTSSSASGPVGSGYCPSDGQVATFFVPLPVTMIGNASVSFDGTLYIYAPSAAGQAVASLGATAYSCGNGVIFTASVDSGTTLSRGGGYILRVNNGSKLIFSAE